MASPIDIGDFGVSVLLPASENCTNFGKSAKNGQYKNVCYNWWLNTCSVWHAPCSLTFQTAANFGRKLTLSVEGFLSLGISNDSFISFQISEIPLFVLHSTILAIFRVRSPEHMGTSLFHCREQHHTYNPKYLHHVGVVLHRRFLFCWGNRMYTFCYLSKIIHILGWQKHYSVSSAWYQQNKHVIRTVKH